jgi:hypothetical protein
MPPYYFPIFSGGFGCCPGNILAKQYLDKLRKEEVSIDSAHRVLINSIRQQRMLKSGGLVTWVASGDPRTLLHGSVLYKVGGGEVDLYFSNSSGGLTCDVKILSGQPQLNGGCKVVGQGSKELQILYNFHSTAPVR